ncbi:MAG: BMP family ABC transporter substrate-binding protein [Bacillota bacterium]|nr:BMP family ABC transporter substrate-binding protein [Bacillota bacterium]
MRMTHKNLFALALVVVFVLMLTSVGVGVSAAPKQKIALIMNQPLGDPFATLVYSGLERLKKERDVETKLIESLDKSEYVEQVRAMARLGYNPVMVLWEDLAAAAIEVAPEFPNTKFIILDCYTTAKLPNVQTVVMEPQEASFIAGFVAAKTTKTKHVGFVGGADIPVIEKFLAGFKAGVAHVDPGIKITAVYAGTFIDPAKGLEMGRMLFTSGADVVMHAANKTGLGVLKAAAEAGKWGIGVDMWQGDVAPGHVLWSALKDAGNATYTMAKKALDGAFEPGMFVFGAKTGAALYDERDFKKLPPQLQSQVLDLEKRIRNGEIKVPSTVK